MFLKHDFQTHLSNSNTCIHYCMQYSLSDKPICDHEHTNYCTICENLDETNESIDQCFKNF